MAYLGLSALGDFGIIHLTFFWRSRIPLPYCVQQGLLSEIPIPPFCLTELEILLWSCLAVPVLELFDFQLRLLILVPLVGESRLTI